MDETSPLPPGRLERFCCAGPGLGIFGRLSVGAFRCYTIEREWADNAADVSCVPCGRYELHPVGSRQHGPAFALAPEIVSLVGDAGRVD